MTRISLAIPTCTKDLHRGKLMMRRVGPTQIVRNKVLGYDGRPSSLRTGSMWDFSISGKITLHLETRRISADLGEIVYGLHKRRPGR